MNREELAAIRERSTRDRLSFSVAVRDIAALVSALEETIAERETLKDDVIRRMCDYYGEDSLTLGNLEATFDDLARGVGVRSTEAANTKEPG